MSSNGDGGGASLAIGSASHAGNLSIQAARARLPVFKQRQWRRRSFHPWVEAAFIQEILNSHFFASSGSQFLHMLEEYPVLIVQGQTGSGKTTQLPQYCYEAASLRQLVHSVHI
jgi:HrpA-like RNA helicase